MAKLKVGQKAHRVLDFLVGLGHRGARRALEGQGFTDADLEGGWRRLKALSHVSPLEPSDPSADLVSELAAWESRWFPVCEVVLRLNFPAVHAVVFAKLRRAEGPEVVMAVTMLLDRLEAIARPEEEGGLGDEGRRARALLAKRNMTDEVFAQGRKLLARIGEEPNAPADEELDAQDREARAAAEQHLWRWYLEWSTLARLAISDRRLLRSLGFRRSARADGGDEGGS
jgi:hypothetical protein